MGCRRSRGYTGRWDEPPRCGPRPATRARIYSPCHLANLLLASQRNRPAGGGSRHHTRGGLMNSSCCIILYNTFKCAICCVCMFVGDACMWTASLRMLPPIVRTSIWIIRIVYACAIVSTRLITDRRTRWLQGSWHYCVLGLCNLQPARWGLWLASTSWHVCKRCLRVCCMVVCLLGMPAW